MYEETRGRKEVKLRGFFPCEKATHIPLKVGTYVCNPHPQVLCPQLVLTGSCKKKGRGRKGLSHARPKLLLKHHANPDLQLWHCKCDFLLRVEL